jgi:RecA/RadA recombinase
MSFLNDLIKSSGNEFASIVEDGLEGADINGFIDTGSYSLNALLSGSMYGGLPNNKIVCFAGEAATGKTYFTIGIVSKFLDSNPEGVVLYFDSEQAVTSDMFRSRGVDPKRVAVFPVATIEEFRQQAITIVDKVLEKPESDRKPMMIVLDSLGMLSTTKEMTDTAEGKGTRDMTRAQVIKSTFRVLTIKLGKAKIPLIMTNHTYDVVGSYVPMKDMSGGAGLKYAASIIVYLSKKKDKDSEGGVIGNIITSKLFKSRLTKENSAVEVQLNYDKGLNKYYGMVDIALECGIFKKVSTKIELPDGKTVFEKHLLEDPEKYFTKEVMAALEAAVGKQFKYGQPSAEGTE